MKMGPSSRAMACPIVCTVHSRLRRPLHNPFPLAEEGWGEGGRVDSVAGVMAFRRWIPSQGWDDGGYAKVSLYRNDEGGGGMTLGSLPPSVHYVSVDYVKVAAGEFEGVSLSN